MTALNATQVSALYAAAQRTFPSTPLPAYSIPVAKTQKFTYLFTDLFGNLLAILPLRGVSFSYALNQAGTFRGTLYVEDPMIAKANWVQATQVNKTCVWVDVTGTLVWGGLVQGQTYTMGAQTVAIAAADFWGYMVQRLQGLDYSTEWATAPGAGAMEIAYTIITNALAAANSLPISVTKEGATPATYWITFAAPLSQQQSIGSLVTQLQQLGYQVGFDFASDVAYAPTGLPTAHITLSYPRRGRIAGTTGLVLATGNATAFTYSVKGTAQADAVVEMATAAGAVSSEYIWEPAMSIDGYPLLEFLGMHTLFTATTEPQAVLNAWGANDLMLNAYPVVVPKLTQNLFDQPVLGQWIVGDDTRFIVSKRSTLPANPRFPNGLDTYFRIVQATITVADEGLSTATFTLNMPPSTSPQRPPL